MNQRPRDTFDLLVVAVVNQAVVQLHTTTITLSKLSQSSGGSVGKVIDVGGVADEQIPPRSGLSRLLPVLLRNGIERDALLIE